jgi:exopolysaccharide production protein ExoQ
MGLFVYSARRTAFEHPRRLMIGTIAAVTLYTAADALFGVKNYVLSALDRDPTLTNRTEIWDIVLSFSTNSMVGTGFMSFWTGERMVAIWKALGAPLNQAHNGYLEQYLNLGFIGVGFIALITVATLASVWRHLQTDYSSAVFRFCIVVVALFYNYTEASFYGLNNMWVLFLAASIDPAPAAQFAQVAQAVPAANRIIASRRRPASASRYRGRRVRTTITDARRTALNKIAGKV